MTDPEIFERLEPLGGLPPKMLIEAMRDDREGFRLILKSPDSESKALRISFDPPLCYRGTQEALLLRKIYEAHDIYPWPLFIVKNSRYAKWFYAQATEAAQREGLHYHIAAMDQIVDVLAVKPPVLEWLTGDARFSFPGINFPAA